MESISMQMVSDIASHLDESITIFVRNHIINNSHNKKFNKSDYDFNTLVYKALEEALAKADETQANPLSKAFKEQNKNRKAMKERWYESVSKKGVNMAYSDPKHPFYNIFIIFQTSSPEQKFNLFQNKTLDEIMQEQFENTKRWYEDKDSKLISFPAIQSITNSKIYNCIKSDIFIYAFNYINEHYDGNIKNFKQLFPNTMISYPLFGEKKEPLDLHQSNDNLVEKLLLSDNSIFQTFIHPTASPSGSVANISENQYSLDSIDLDFFQYGMFANIDATFYNTKAVVTTLSTYAKIMNSHPNKKYLQRAANRLNNYPNKAYEYTNKSNNIVLDKFVLIDRVQIINPDNYIDSDEFPYSPDAKVIVTFGERLYEEIVSEQMTLITKNSYELISSTLAKLLCPVLQRERTILTFDLDYSKNIDIQMTRVYNYSFFARSVRNLSVKNNAQNRELLTSTIKEFLEAKLFVKGISIHGDTFKITYFPLSDDEKADIDFHWNKNAQLLDVNSDDDEVEGQMRLFD